MSVINSYLTLSCYGADASIFSFFPEEGSRSREVCRVREGKTLI